MTERSDRRPNPFALTGQVGRGEYAAVGFSLMLVKYLVEAGVILATTGLYYTVIDFFTPLISHREEFLNEGPVWLGFAWLAWTVPFVWIAVAMTLRRARDAGASPWVCLLILVPGLNFVIMLAMAAVPHYVPWSQRDQKTQERDAEQQLTEQQLREAWAAPQTEDSATGLDSELNIRGGLLAVNSALAGLGVGVLYSLAVTVLSVYGLGDYGAALFFGSPVVTGAAAAYIYNRSEPRSLGATFRHSLLLIVCCCAAFLLVGLEGMICIIMAIPILAPMMLFGALIGWAIALSGHAKRDDQGLVGCLIVLPLLAGMEQIVTQPLPLMVETSVDIDAAPTEVWRMVVEFPEIDSRPEWYFRWGIASPLRASIDGSGVGAVRHCDFTTGSFVEPITVWDEPRRLAFDVTSQPEPMFELTPYRHLHPPHLTGSFRSTRGEFELIKISNGGTRLVGRTWYMLDIAPHGYWRNWTDQIVCRIHLRVLRHIKTIAEEESNFRAD